MQFKRKDHQAMNIRNIIIIAAALIFSPSLTLSFEGPPGCSMDCASCHSLGEEEAGKLLRIENVKISDSPAKGIWQVDGTQKGKRVRVYLDYAKKNVMLINSFIPIESIGKPPKPRKFDIKDIPLTGTIIIGDPKAKNRIIVFDDPDCPYCRKLHKEIKKILNQRKDIAFYIKLYPLAMHPDAYEKSKAILCEDSLELLDAAFEGKPLPKARCDTREVDQNIETAKKLGISGTPAIILPDGRLIPGYVEAGVILNMLDPPPE